MPQPIFEGDQKYTELGQEVFTGKVLIGAAGAPTMKAQYITFSRVSAGLYNVSFPRRYRRLVHADLTLLQAAGVLTWFLRADNLNSATPTIQVLIATNAGVATDLANGDAILFKLTASAAANLRV